MRAYRKIDDHYEVKIEKGRLVVLGVGAGLTLLLVFLVGVLVGKGLWGTRPEAPPPTAAAGSASTAREGEKPQYTFYDDLKRPDSAGPNVVPKAPGGQESIGETAVMAPGGVPAGAAGADARPSGERPAETARQTEVAAKAPEMPKTAPTAKSPAEGKGMEAAKALEAKKPLEPPKPVPAEKLAQTAGSATTAKPAAEAKVSSPSYTVQVGSFRDRASADDQMKKIAALGIVAQVVSAPMEGRTWFRVQVGRYDTRADAESYYQKKLRPKGVQGFVTQR